MKRRLYVTNLSLENNLPTFQLNTAVVIGAKLKKCEQMLPYTTVRVHVIEGQRLVRITPPFLPPHRSGPATREFQSYISVEVFL